MSLPLLQQLFFVIVALTWLPCSCIDVNWHQRLLQPSSHCDDVVKTLWTEAVKCAPVAYIAYVVIQVWQTCFQLLRTICLEQVTAIHPISQ